MDVLVPRCQIWFVLHRRPISRQIYRIYLTRSKRLHWIHHNSPLACQLVISLSSAHHWARLSPSRSRRSRRSRRAFGLETWPRWSPAPQFRRRRGHRGHRGRRGRLDADSFRPRLEGPRAVEAGPYEKSIRMWWSCENMWEYLTSFNINLQFMNIYDYLCFCFEMFLSLHDLNWSELVCWPLSFEPGGRHFFGLCGTTGLSSSSRLGKDVRKRCHKMTLFEHFEAVNSRVQLLLPALLYYTILYCTILYYTILHYTIQYNTYIYIYI